MHNDAPYFIITNLLLLLLFNHLACIRTKAEPEPEPGSDSEVDDESKPAVFHLDDSNHSLVLNLMHEQEDDNPDQIMSCIRESDLHRALQPDPTFEELVSQLS